jgi:hypothetical protein
MYAHPSIRGRFGFMRRCPLHDCKASADQCRARAARKAPVLAEQARAMAFASPDGYKGLRDARCYCWASQVLFDDPSSWCSMLLTSKKTEDGSKIDCDRARHDLPAPPARLTHRLMR